MDKGYAICLNKWTLDEEIKGELRLLLIVSSLCAKEGYCYASNEYLAKLFNTTDVSISRKLKRLSDKGYITINYEKRGCEVVSREIRLTKMLTDDYQICKPTINKNVKDNNTSINNTSINKYKSFVKPDITEVEAYCKIRKNNIDAQSFIDYYESVGWKIGNKPMKNWQATIRTWEQRHKSETRRSTDALPTYDCSKNTHISDDEEQELLKLMGKTK